MKMYFIAVLLLFTLLSNAQSGAVIGVGASLGYTDNPAVMAKAGALSGWHISVTARLGPDWKVLVFSIHSKRVQLCSL